MTRVEAVRRDFEVRVGQQRAWDLLSEVTRWTEWAPHIVRAEVDPAGPVGPDSTGTLHIRRFGTNQFVMTDWQPPNHWQWRGGIPGVDIHYDHEFTVVDRGTTLLTWVVVLDGPLARVISPVFARIYGSNLDRAIPRLQTWFDAQ